MRFAPSCVTLRHVVIFDKNWPKYEDPSGFSFRLPPGWAAHPHPTGGTGVVSPDQEAWTNMTTGPDTTEDIIESPVVVIAPSDNPSAAAVPSVYHGMIELKANPNPLGSG